MLSFRKFLLFRGQEELKLFLTTASGQIFFRGCFGGEVTKHV